MDIVGVVEKLLDATVPMLFTGLGVLLGGKDAAASPVPLLVPAAAVTVADAGDDDDVGMGSWSTVIIYCARTESLKTDRTRRELLATR